MATGTPKFEYRSFKRGDTKTFGWRFVPPYAGFDWSKYVIDSAMTDVASPTSNTQALSLRIAQALTVDPVTNIATYVHKLTYAESSKAVPTRAYKVEAELRTTDNSDVNTPVTGTVTVEQDYVFPS